MFFVEVFDKMRKAACDRLLLTLRDISILVMIFSYGGCTAEQIARRFFPSPGARSAYYQRLAKLTAAGFLRSARLPSLSGKGSGRAFLTLGSPGAQIVASQLELPVEQVRSAKDAPTPLFVKHHLAIGDFRLALELASEHLGFVSVEEWVAEKELKRSPIRLIDPESKQSIQLVPDGQFTLTLDNGLGRNFRLEMDLGTVAPKRMQSKLRGYLLEGRDIPVLFVLPDRLRQAAVARWAESEASKLHADSTMFWLTQNWQVSSQSILLTPVWQIVGGPAAQPLVRAELLGNGQLVGASQP